MGCIVAGHYGAPRQYRQEKTRLLSGLSISMVMMKDYGFMEQHIKSQLPYQLSYAPIAASAEAGSKQAVSAVARRAASTIGTIRSGRRQEKAYSPRLLLSFHAPPYAPAKIASEIFSAVISTGKFVLAHGTTGNTEASVTRS